LKVFCASSGFHDAVVAAPSKPAALKAWGAKTDLFSMGVARLVTDPKIAKKALERPGEVIRLKRSGKGEEVEAPKRTERKKTKPPSRAKLAAAERKLEQITHRQEAERETVEREIRKLEQKLEQLGKRHSRARKAAKAKLEEERDSYQAALADWEA
jgi:hypothetical protein